MPWLQSLKSKPEQCPNICKNKSWKVLNISEISEKSALKKTNIAMLCQKHEKWIWGERGKRYSGHLPWHCNGLILYETEFSSQFIKKHARIKRSRYIKSRSKAEAAT